MKKQKHIFQIPIDLNLILILGMVLGVSSCKILPQKFPGLKVQKNRTEQVDKDFKFALQKMDSTISQQNELLKTIHQRMELLEQKFQNRQMEEQTYERLKNFYEGQERITNNQKSTVEHMKNRVDDYKETAPEKRRYFKDFENEYKGYLTETLNRVDDVHNDVMSNQKKMDIYDDLLQSDLTEEFELSVFFPSGVYQLKAEDMEAAKGAFSPLVLRIKEFIARYPDRELDIRIMTKGYADSQPIGASSALGKDLSGKTTADNPDSKELNRVLSELRAMEISSVVFQILEKDDTNITGDSKYHLKMEPVGMGEILPNPNITDYTKDDRRRRIVTLFWDVLPTIK